MTPRGICPWLNCTRPSVYPAHDAKHNPHQWANLCADHTAACADPEVLRNLASHLKTTKPANPFSVYANTTHEPTGEVL